MILFYHRVISSRSARWLVRWFTIITVTHYGCCYQLSGVNATLRVGLNDLRVMWDVLRAGSRCWQSAYTSSACEARNSTPGVLGGGRGGEECDWVHPLEPHTDTLCVKCLPPQVGSRRINVICARYGEFHKKMHYLLLLGLVFVVVFVCFWVFWVLWMEICMFQVINILVYNLGSNLYLLQ